MVNKIDYKKLKKDLSTKLGTLGIMSIGLNVEPVSERKLLGLAKKYNLNISDYTND